MGGRAGGRARDRRAGAKARNRVGCLRTKRWFVSRGRPQVLYPTAGSASASEWLNSFATAGRTVTEEEKEKARQSRIDAMNREIQEVHAGVHAHALCAAFV